MDCEIGRGEGVREFKGRRLDFVHREDLSWHPEVVRGFVRICWLSEMERAMRCLIGDA